MKKLVISAALALVSITMSAQDIYQFSNESKPKTYKLTKKAGATPGQQSQDSLSVVQRTTHSSNLQPSTPPHRSTSVQNISESRHTLTTLPSDLLEARQ